jgi:hypothetical protein
MKINKLLKSKSLRFIVASLVIALLPILNIFSFGIELTSGIRIELLYIPAILCIPLLIIKTIEKLVNCISNRLKNKSQEPN